MTYTELKQNVIKRGFARSTAGTATTGEQVIFSAGISLIYKFADEDIQNALNLFINGDYGSFYDYDEKPTINSEYGEYKSIFGFSADTGAIMIHREQNTIIIYFQFER